MLRSECIHGYLFIGSSNSGIVCHSSHGDEAIRWRSGLSLPSPLHAVALVTAEVVLGVGVVGLRVVVVLLLAGPDAAAYESTVDVEGGEEQIFFFSPISIITFDAVMVSPLPYKSWNYHFTGIPGNPTQNMSSVWETLSRNNVLCTLFHALAPYCSPRARNII